MTSRSEFDIFDRTPDPTLDELTKLAAALCLSDYGYVGWMDFNRVWFKSQWGFSAADVAGAGTACRWVAETCRPVLICDASDDRRFSPPGIYVPGGQFCRSYAGIPLLDDENRTVGILAVLARGANQFDQGHLNLLEVLGRQIMAHVELHRRIRAQEQEQREKRRMQRELEAERAFIAQAFDLVPAALAVLDVSARVLRFNTPCAQLLEWSAADGRGRFLLDEVLEKPDHQWAVTKIHEAVTGHTSGPHENTWRVAGGSTRLMRWTLSPIKGSNGEAEYLMLSAHDVSKQRELENALLKTESRFNSLVERSLGFIFTCTVDGSLISLNPFTAETLGYRAEMLIGRSLAEIVDAADAEKFRDGLRHLDLVGEWQGAVSFRCSDGTHRRIALRSRRLDLNGEQPFIVSHGVDITEQHGATQALQRSQRKLELILHTVDEGVCSIDAGGRLTFINDAGARTLGYEPDQLTGRNIHWLLNHGADNGLQPESTSPILQAMHQGETMRDSEAAFRCADGNCLPVSYAAAPLIEDGHIDGMLIAFRDISERRRLDKMKDEFISTVSHELRTPLASLRASLGLISSGSLTQRPEKQREMVDMAIDNCDRLIRLVNNIVDFEKAQTGVTPLHQTPVDAVDLLRRAAHVALPAASQADIGLRIEAQTALVLADEDRVLQVLQELLSNAIRFSPPETTIRLRALPTGQQTVCFLVQDEGQGIPPDKLDSIFDRFQQGDASDSRTFGGTGLGLALCRKIIELHGGDIWAENAPGKGSRFLFTLPRTTHKTQ